MIRTGIIILVTHVIRDRMKVIAGIKLTKAYKYWENAIGSDNHKKAKEDSGIFFLE